MISRLLSESKIRKIKMPLFTCVDHMNVQVPPDREEEALAFYRDLIGFIPLQKPDSLGPRGGHFCVSEDPWYELHVGVARGTSSSELDKDSPLRNHLAFQVVDLLETRQKFEQSGIDVIEAQPAYSETRNFYQERFFVRDPGGNLLEILEKRQPYQAVRN
jgi:catechol 2,3-dioxygenase-like lactoylglutathione lyase family enzyme